MEIRSLTQTQGAKIKVLPGLYFFWRLREDVFLAPSHSRRLAAQDTSLVALLFQLPHLLLTVTLLPVFITILAMTLGPSK